MNRLLPITIMILLSGCTTVREGMIMTVSGPVKPDEIGLTLTHEHVLVDFIGADSISYDRWDKAEVESVVIPFLEEARQKGTRTLIECTPAYLGRDPELLRSLSVKSGLKIITNTGYYGAGRDRYIPAHAYRESADELTERWVKEWKKGIEGTGIRPGFIKIGVMGGDLSELHRKLVTAAARTHLKTGLVIASHTGTAIPAFAQLGLLVSEGVSPEAFIWVHAQTEKDSVSHILAAQAGTWISFDGLNEENTGEYVRLLKIMKKNGLLDHVLISHDAGWYRPDQKGGGEYRGYTPMFMKLIPALEKEGFTEDEIKLLLVVNPANAFIVRVRSSEKFHP